MLLALSCCRCKLSQAGHMAEVFIPDGNGMRSKLSTAPRLLDIDDDPEILHTHTPYSWPSLLVVTAFAEFIHVRIVPHTAKSCHVDNDMQHGLVPRATM